MSILQSLAISAQDVRHFGPSVLWKASSRNNQQVVRTKFGQFSIRRHDSDMGTLRQVYIGRDYDLDRFRQGAAVRNHCQSIIDRGNKPVIIDAGANAGFATRFLASAYPQAHILAVEPDPHSAAMCRQNTAHLPSVEVIEAALGAQPGRVVLAREDANGETRQSNAIRTHRASDGVPVTTIGELQAKIPGSELLIVKIDIEGFEADLFSSATDWVSQAYVVIIEPHDWMLPGAGSSTGLQRSMLAQGRELLISGDSLVWVKAANTEGSKPFPGGAF